MKFILYTSVLNLDDYDPSVIPSIIRVARRENLINHVTGVLLFDGLNFTQYFEGENEVVDVLAKKLMQDQRHKNILIVAEGQIQERLYDDWEMGYILVNEHDIDIRRCMGRTDFTLDMFKDKVSHMDVGW